MLQVKAAARVTRLFKDELPCEQKTYATRSTAAPRNTELFGSATQQPGSERLIMKKSDLRNKGAMTNLAVSLLWQDDGEWWNAKITQASANGTACGHVVLLDVRHDMHMCSCICKYRYELCRGQQVSVHGCIYHLLFVHPSSVPQTCTCKHSVLLVYELQCNPVVCT